jgi:hypothetical protein
LVYHVTHADALGGAARNLGDLSTWLFLENPIAVTGELSRYACPVQRDPFESASELWRAAGPDRSDLRLLGAEVVRNIELDDAERSAAATMLEAHHALERGYLDDVTVDLLGRTPTPGERQRFLEFLSALRREGL